MNDYLTTNGKEGLSPGDVLTVSPISCVSYLVTFVNFALSDCCLCCFSSNFSSSSSFLLSSHSLVVKPVYTYNLNLCLVY